ncbi:MAG: hypothetical protein Kow0090_22640 [Myxococcota bacterium]
MALDSLRSEMANIQVRQKEMDERLDRLNARLDILVNRYGQEGDKSAKSKPSASKGDDGAEEELVPPDLKVVQLQPKEAPKKAKVVGDKDYGYSDAELERLSKDVGKIPVSKSLPESINSPPRFSDAEEAQEDGKELLPAAGESKPSENSPLSLYQTAFNAYAIEDCKLAVKKFIQFIAVYPNHYYTDNAVYYLAECYEKESDFDNAEKNYRKIIKSYEKSERVPWALFRLAKLVREKDLKRSQELAARLVNNYPDSEPAGLAKKEFGIK